MIVKYYMLHFRHIGDGIVDPSVWSPCYMKPSGDHAVAMDAADNLHNGDSVYLGHLQANPGSTAYVQVRNSHSGRPVSSARSSRST